MNESPNCCNHSENIELFGYRSKYRIELSEIKRNVDLNIKLNISKSQMNRYLENVLYRGVAGYLIKIQNSPTVYINADEFVFDSDHG